MNEGVKFRWNSSMTELHDTGGVLDGIVLSEPDGPVSLPADIVIMAVGSRPASRIVSTTHGIEVDDKGYVITRDIPYGMTTRKGVFAGGDVANNPATVVHAMQDAQRVAEGIATYVDAMKLLETIDMTTAES